MAAPMTRPVIILSLSLLYLILAVSGLEAVEQEGETVPSGNPHSKVGVTLKDCVWRVYEANVGFKVTEMAVDSAATSVDETLGRFDPEYFATLTGSENISPVSNPYERAFGVNSYDVDLFNVSTGFRGTLLSGATYTLSLNFNRSFIAASQNYESSLAFNPYTNSNLGIDIRQPLLKGAWTAFNRAETLQAGINTQGQALTMETTLNDLAFEVIEAYWNLIFTREDLEAKEKSLELAKDLLAINTRKKQEGVFSKMEVLEASAEVALKEEQLITSRNAVQAAEDVLKHLIYPFDQPSEWEIRIDTLTEAQEAEVFDYDMEALVKNALDNRSDYRQRKLDLQDRELDLLTARNGLLPTLDLTGAWRYASLARNMGVSLDDIGKRSFRYFSVGMELAYPLGNRSGRYAMKRAEIDHQRSLISLRDLEIQVAHEIRDAVRDVALQRKKIAATRESCRLASERYEGEKKRLEAGISIPYQVREAERNLLTETVAKARSLLDYQIAIARVAKVQGILLNEYGINLPRTDLNTWLDRAGKTIFD